MNPNHGSVSRINSIDDLWVRTAKTSDMDDIHGLIAAGMDKDSQKHLVMCRHRKRLTDPIPSDRVWSGTMDWCSVCPKKIHQRSLGRSHPARDLTSTSHRGLGSYQARQHTRGSNNNKTDTQAGARTGYPSQLLSKRSMRHK